MKSCRSERSDAFAELHPAVEFLYFALVIGLSMFAAHPVCQLISLSGAVGYMLCRTGGQALKSLCRLLPLMLLTALINPLFSHEGATILAYFPNGNPLTLESIICGLSTALTLAAVVCWFSSVSAVLTSDKFVWLFGRIIPALSLILSMALRFVPRFASHMKDAADAQKLLGNDVSKGSVRSRVKTAVAILSGTVTWAMENSLVTADSMKSRGWGLRGRTAYTDYRLDSRDKALLALIIGFGGYTLAGYISGGVYFRFYPTVKGIGFGAFPASFFFAYLVLAFAPLMFDLAEDCRWKRLRSGL